MKNRILSLLAAGLTLWACQPGGKGEWKPTDLIRYGVPVVVLAPDSLDVKNQSLARGLVQDVAIKGGEDYDVQLYIAPAETNDISRIKAGLLAEVKSGRSFSRIVREEEPGFIYETRLDSSQLYYGFRYIHLQADKEYIFQSGYSALFSLEQAERLYSAVKPLRR